MKIATAKTVAAIGFIASIVSIIGWFGITPEMIGEYAYSVFYILLPFVLFFSGFAVGWWARWRMKESQKQMDEERAMEEERNHELENAFKSLDFGTKLWMHGIYLYGESINEQKIKMRADPDTLNMFVDHEEIDYTNYRWTLKPGIKEFLEKREYLFNDVEAFEKKIGIVKGEDSLIWAERSDV